ncbi:MAG: hypothetical protein AB8G95_13230 [Anaerolineae bacterium]
MKKYFALILFSITLIGCTTPPEFSEPAASVEQSTPSTPPTEVPLLEEYPNLSWEFSTISVNDSDIDYATLLPPDYDPSKTYPLLIALPPGGQDRRMVDAGLDGFWKVGALYDFIIVSPAKPADSNYMSEGSLLLPAFVDHLHNTFNIDGKPHLGGVSNGGISTFKAGLERPDLYQSLTVLPGYARTSSGDPKTLADLKITIYVGANDGQWVTNSRATNDWLVNAGHTDTQLEIFADEGHIIQPLNGDGAGKIFLRLLDQS